MLSSVYGPACTSNSSAFRANALASLTSSWRRARLASCCDTLVARFPDLRELIVGGTLHPSVVANLNGDEFVSDRRQALAEGDHVLILSADVGG